MQLHKITEFLPEVSILQAGSFGCFANLSFVRRANTLVFAIDQAYAQKSLEHPLVSALITTPEGALNLDTRGKAVAVCQNPKRAFFAFHNFLAQKTDFYGVQQANNISPTAVISNRAYLADHDVTIGAGTIISPNATILPHTHIGENCYIGSGTVIGDRGYQYYFSPDEESFYVEHVARVVLEDFVEVLANCTIARGLFEDTIIGRGCKIDSLSNVAHSCVLGPNVLLTSGVILGGSVQIGQNSWVGMNATVRQMLTVGENAYICMDSTVTQPVQAGQKIAGNFAMEQSRWIHFVKSQVSSEYATE